MIFCTHCGTKSAEGASFCTKCGAKTDALEGTRANAQFAPNSGDEQISPSAKPQPLAVADNLSRRKRLFLFAGGIILISAVVGITAAVYVGHRIEERISTDSHGSTTSVKRTGKMADRGDGRSTDALQAGGKYDGPQNDGSDPNVAKGLDAIGGLMDKMGFGDRPTDPYQDLPTLTTADANKLACPSVAQNSHPFETTDTSPDSGRIPFREGLILTAAWGRQFGDVESTSTIGSIKPDFVEIANSGTYFKSDDDAVGGSNSNRRYVCLQDLQDAHGYITSYKRTYPLIAPGTTTSFLSSAAFGDLKTRGKTNLRYLLYYPADEGGQRLHWQEAEITRVERDDVPYAVTVNDEPTTLPAIHATGTMLTIDKKARELSTGPIDQPLSTELYVLDDPNDPIVLLYRMDIKDFRIQVIRITVPSEKPETKIEEQLAKTKKAVVYGIYFDYNSDKIKNESEPVLNEIAQALKNNPNWKLAVDGHTDSIGGDAYNLDLSKRRAASVKQALVARFQINGDRLVTDGFGLRRPVDRNDTLEGRARNRRVELTRE
jgi:hypothetical protein